MKNKFARARRPSAAVPVLLILAVAAVPAVLYAQTGAQAAPDAGRIAAESPASTLTPETVVRKWPEYSRGIARAMIDTYGQPQRFGENLLAWDDNGVWKRSIVYRNAWPHSLAMRDKDSLEQTIGYQVPADKIEALRRFDKRIKVDAANGELSSRSVSEKLNYLALNLAEEIITEKRSVEDARDFYRKTEELAKSGKSSPYLERFIFSIDDDKRIVPDYMGPEFH